MQGQPGTKPTDKPSWTAKVVNVLNSEVYVLADWDWVGVSLSS